MKDKLTVLVNTCDKYEFLWSDFKNLFDKNFPTELNLDVCLLSQTKTSSLFDKCFTPGPIEFSKAVEHALNKIDTPYFLWLQDDYFIDSKLTSKELQRYLMLVEKYKMDRLGICETSDHYTMNRLQDGEDELYKFHPRSLYTMSLQASIFRKDWMLDIINDQTWNPWQLELTGSDTINRFGKSSHIYMVHRYFYSEAKRKGKDTDFYKVYKMYKQFLKK